MQYTQDFFKSSWKWRNLYTSESQVYNYILYWHSILRESIKFLKYDHTLILDETFIITEVQTSIAGTIYHEKKLMRRYWSGKNLELHIYKYMKTLFYCLVFWYTSIWGFRSVIRYHDQISICHFILLHSIYCSSNYRIPLYNSEVEDKNLLLKCLLQWMSGNQYSFSQCCQNISK